MKAFLSKWINFLLCGYRAVYFSDRLLKLIHTLLHIQIQVNYTPSCLDVKTMSLNPRLCRNRYFPVLGTGNCLDVAEFLVRWRWEQLLERVLKQTLKSYTRSVHCLIKEFVMPIIILSNVFLFSVDLWLALYSIPVFIYTVITNLLQYLLIWL